MWPHCFMRMKYCGLLRLCHARRTPLCAIVARSYTDELATLLTLDILTLWLAKCIVITPMIISVIEACVCLVQDTSLYASGRPRSWSTNAALSKPSLRARGYTKKGHYATSYQFSSTVSWWLRHLPTPCVPRRLLEWTNTTQLLVTVKNDAQN
jgi:hypothetical protein